MTSFDFKSLYSFFGVDHEAVIALLVIMVIELLTKLLLALYKRKKILRVSARCLVRKLSMISVVFMVRVINLHVIKSDHSFSTITIALFIATEGLKILDNATRLGTPIPKQLREGLQRYVTPEEDDDDPENPSNTE